MSAKDGAHIDPDLKPQSLSRKSGWTAIFGPSEAAQTHLIRNGVGIGDLFLFFGWFKQTEWRQGRLKFISSAPDIHLMFGWLQVGMTKNAKEFSAKERAWAEYHPHFHPQRLNSSVIYLATENLQVRGVRTGMPGYRVFPLYREALRLTAPGGSRSTWRLPKWFYPGNGRPALSYHGDLSRWEREQNCVYLRTVGRGQEFVLDCDYYPEWLDWFDQFYDH